MEITTIGVDLAKTVFQIHGVDAQGKVVVRKALRCSQMIPFFEKLPSCLVGIEACGTSHHWARELIKLGRRLTRFRSQVLGWFRTQFSPDCAPAGERSRLITC